MVLFCLGCSKKDETFGMFIKTSLTGITKEEFLEELEIKKSAYPYDIKQNISEYII